MKRKQSKSGGRIVNFVGHWAFSWLSRMVRVGIVEGKPLENCLFSFFKTIRYVRCYYALGVALLVSLGKLCN